MSRGSVSLPSPFVDDTSQPRLSRLELSVFITVLIANLVPVWAFRYFAGQDTPNHLYAGEILATLRTGTAPLNVATTFAATLGLKSNVAFHFLLLKLVDFGLSLEVAHRLILSGYAIAFPAAALFCARTAMPKSQPLALLFLPLTWNWFVLQGLYNYVLSLVGAFVWLAYVARDGGRPGRLSSFVIALSSLAVYFCHVGTFVMLLVVTALRIGLPIEGTPPSWRARLASARRLALALSPALAIACAGTLMSWRGERAPPEVTLSAIEGYSLVEAVGAFFLEFAMRYRLADIVVLGPPLLALIVWPLWAFRNHRPAVGAAENGSSPWPLCAAAVLIALYFVLPHIAWGSDVSPRLRPIILLCLFCYGGVTLSRRARRLISILTLLSGLSSVALLCSSFIELNQQLRDFTSGIPWVRRGARLYPMVFDPRSPSLLVKPFLHAWGYYGLERDIVTPFAFAWHPARFPYRYRDLSIHGQSSALASDAEDEPYALLEGRACRSVQRLAPSRSCEDVRAETEDRLARLGRFYDYVLTWRAPDDFSRLLLARGYSVLHAQGAMVLYRPTSSAPPDTSAPI